MHQKRVTCELHDSYFHLMRIKNAISKIEWALNHYITQLSSSPGGSLSSSRVGDRDRRDVVGKATSGGKGPLSPDELGSREDADKMQ